VPLLHALVKACENGASAAESMKLLLSAGADINATCLDDIGNESTALMWACKDLECGYCKEVVQTLLDGGADPCFQAAADEGMGEVEDMYYGDTALHYAVDAGKQEICTMMISANGGRILDLHGSFGNTALTTAVKRGFVDIVKLLHAHGADVNAIDEEDDCKTLLACAAELPDLATLQYLLSTGECDVDEDMNDGYTAVFNAAKVGNLAAVKLLVEHGADLSIIDENGCNVVTSAVDSGCVDVVKYLHTCGADLQVMTEFGKSALAIAANSGCAAVVEYLIVSGVSVAVTDDNGQTPLFDAARWGHAPTVELLLRAGAAVNHSDRTGNTPLAEALKSQIYFRSKPPDRLSAEAAHLDCIKLLLDAGADVTRLPQRFVELAVKGAAGVEAVQLLLLQCSSTMASFNSERKRCDCCGKTTVLTWCDKPEILKLILAAGADVRKVSSKGYTCLHSAVIHEHSTPVLCLLIKAGVDVKAVDHSGHTAADIAHTMGSTLAESLLRRAAHFK
jgi:uncharacterized protein